MKNFFVRIFNKQNLIYTLSLILLVVVLVVNRIITGFNNILWISDIGSIFFLAYLIFFAKHNVWAFLLNIIATAFVGINAIMQHLYFNFALAFLFTIPLQIRGWILWKKRESKNENFHSLTKKQIMWLIVAFIIVLPVVITILYFLKGNLIVLDGVCSTLTILGVLLATNTYIENFYVFTLSNFLYAILYLILCFTNINNITFVIINLVGTVITISSIFNWKKLSNTKTENNTLNKNKNLEIK